MKQYLEEVKILAVNCYKHYSFQIVNSIFNCSKSSISRWTKIYNNTNEIKRKERIVDAYKVKKEHIEFIINEIVKHKTISLKDISNILLNNYLLKISEQYIGKILYKNNFTRKRVRHGHFPKTRYNVEINKRSELNKFYNEVSKYSIDKIISIDETSLSLFMYKKYGFSLKGKRCIEITNNNKVFTKHTFIGAITSNKILKYTLYEKDSINSNRFYDFINELINENKLKNYLFIFDNVSSHKTKEIQEFINKDNKLLYSVPYNPQCNPIENWFSQFKHYLSDSVTKTYNTLKDSIKNVLQNIKPRHYYNYFNNILNTKIKDFNIIIKYITYVYL